MKNGPLGGDGPDPRGRLFNSPNINVGLVKEHLVLANSGAAAWRGSSLRPYWVARELGESSVRRS